jgi:hypothetical protein
MINKKVLDTPGLFNYGKNLYNKEKSGGFLMSDINAGDVFFQLVMLLFLIVPAVLIFYGVRSWRKRTKQLERIERKLDERR